jgi:hypothetical protein
MSTCPLTFSILNFTIRSGVIAIWTGTRTWTLVLVGLAGFTTALDSLVVATALAWGLIDGRAARLLPGAALLAAVLVGEARAPEPMLPLRLFRSRGFTATSASGLLMSASLMPAAVLIAQYLHSAWAAHRWRLASAFCP